LFGAGFWLMWEGCDIPGPSFCSDRMGHAVPCAARHHIESVQQSISKPSMTLSDGVAFHGGGQVPFAGGTRHMLSVVEWSCWSDSSSWYPQGVGEAQA
jgi:hypothetical protein